MSAVMVILNWERFQHYKDRSAPWVKLHRDMLSSESWVLGNDASRVVQIASMMLAPRYNNKIPCNFELLKPVMALKCTQREFDAAIEHLVRYEFLAIQSLPTVAQSMEQSASNVLAKCSSEERENRGEGEGEKKPPNPLSGGMVSRETIRAESKRRTPKKPETALPDDFTLDADLTQYATDHLPDVDPSALLENFKLQAKNKQWRYADWRLAFMQYVRNAQPDSGHFAAGQYPRKHANGNGKARYRSADELERDEIARGVAEGRTDEEIAKDYRGAVSVDRIRKIRAEVSRAQH